MSDANSDPDPRLSRKVSKLRAGTVVDHLKPGSALLALRVLGLEGPDIVAIGMNFPSAKFGTKDIIKIENRFLSPEEINLLALISPDATITIIRDYEVQEKFTARMPDEARGITRCPNPSCVTNHTAMETRFAVEQSGPWLLRCHYCERAFGAELLQFH